MDDEIFESGPVVEYARAVDGVDRRTKGLTASANGLARAMSQAFTQATIGGRALDDVLKSLAMRLSSMALTMAFKPIAQSLLGGLESAFGLGTAQRNALGAVKPFAAGGIIGTPTYFPLSNGGVGLAGEAGPEAIMPLSRGADGKLGVAMSGGGATHVTIHIATPDAESFRRSEAYLSGQIARAIARGQRSL